ncbi:hypothetical protein GCM10010211_83990 [Streptomyces albospinus]|uniref:Transposase n=1 Tax=Streptomyces albospinus TaxID=285515 RepID=A0ABQ2VQ15_9ACTN|nr:hypothetical protein [Streptomyces albospinus]GGV03948.1 hypothetical protein GCM10010211_83990 [Streptomyces albospinus]
MLGERVWAESGIGAPTDVEELRCRITTLEQQVVNLTDWLEERDQDLDADRVADREPMSRLNAPRPGHRQGS